MLAHSTCAESFGSLNDFKSILVILSHDGGSNPLMSCKWIQLIDTVTTTTEGHFHHSRLENTNNCTITDGNTD